MKKSLVFFIGLFIFLWTGAVNAELIKIGSADYDSNGDGIADIFDLNLIWDDDNNGNSLVWLDYSNGCADWNAQIAWAADLISALTVQIYPGYSVKWDDASWRLPTTIDGQEIWGSDGKTTAGYNITNSEMGHLFYVELNNVYSYEVEWSLNDTGIFENLSISGEPWMKNWYWSETQYAVNLFEAWSFSMYSGDQNKVSKNNPYRGLAVRTAQVSMVPEPATILLFGLGLLGFARISRKKTNGYYFT
jgi:hypothetical protein